MELKSLSEYINKEFPSDYVTGDDIGKAQIPVVIEKYEVKIVENPKKKMKQNRLVLHFKGKEKGLIIAKTRANELKMLFGDNPKDLIGKEIVLYTKQERSFGETKNIVHIMGKELIPNYVAPEETVELDDIEFGGK